MSNKIVFTESFLSAFNVLNETIDSMLDSFNNIEFNYDYAVCKCCYKMRYITPSDLSSYISYVTKVNGQGIMRWDLLPISDLSMFNVGIVKRFMEQNGCVPFESSTFPGISKISLKNTTLHDLILMAEYDCIDTCTYSSAELVIRKNEAGKDIDKFKQMRLYASMKNLIDRIPTILDSSDRSIGNMIEEFIIFMMTLNLSTIVGIFNYVNPISAYGFNKEESITECALMKTNGLRTRYNIPFDINIRNIVLSDSSEDMKDTTAALDYIVKNANSPISALLVQYGDKDAYSTDYCSIVLKLLPNGKDVAINTCQPAYDNDHDAKSSRFQSLSNRDSWLDKIALGNNYLDMCYRRDRTGNAHTNAITDTLDTIYKMFGGCDLKSNEQLATNVIRVYHIMKALIVHHVRSEYFNTGALKEILCLLGEIFIRDVLKLYHNTTRAFDYSDSMPDAMGSSMRIMESCVLESYMMEETTQQTTGQQTTVPEADINNKTEKAKPSVSMNNNGKDKQVGISILQRFADWIVREFSQFFKKFNQNHKLEIDYITKNDKLNTEISNALQKTFSPTVNNFPNYNIPAAELSKGSVKPVIDNWLNGKDPIDIKKIKSQIYPGGENEAGGKIANAPDNGKEIALLTNYILYSNITAPQPYNGPLTKAKWDELVTDLKTSFKLMEQVNTKMGEDLKSTCDNLKTKMGSSDNVSEASQRATELFKVVQSVGQTYQTATVNVLAKQFYGTSYKLYRDIISAYNQQSSQAINSNNTNTQANQRQNPQQSNQQQNNQNTDTVPTPPQQ